MAPPSAALHFGGILAMTSMMRLPPGEAERYAQDVDAAFEVLFEVTAARPIRPAPEHARAVEELGELFRWWTTVRPYLLDASSRRLQPADRRRA